ncbi:MAG: stage V sporulation protein E [Heliobacteriaceae bacterium]|nr:stage V sporulation protein E [Heliobacteriaceae bacterium]MDD4588078.1 stage V sporulation protein E [Heliobacteriaceae bacterium]
MRLKQRAPDFAIFLAVLLLLTFGIIMVMSASSVTAAYMHNDPYHFFKRQALWAFLGIGAMLLVMRVDYRRLMNYRKGFLVAGLVLLCAVFIPGVGKEINNSWRWLNLGPATFQPSELMKLAVIIFVAGNLAKAPYKLARFRTGLAPYLGLMALVGVLIVCQPDLGTALVICGTVFVMLYVAGAKNWHMGLLGIGGVVAVLVAALIKPYRLKRLTGFIDPWADPVGSGYQTLQSLFALGSGGLFGYGLGQSKQKYFYLPERHTDFVFAILGEELGLIGAVCVILLFFILIWRGLRIAVACPDSFGSLLAVGLTTQIALQTVTNMGVVSGLLPVTGITLPFISYGGSSLVFSLVGVGLLLSVSRYTPR